MYSSKFSCAIKVAFYFKVPITQWLEVDASIMRQLNNNYQYGKEI